MSVEIMTGVLKACLSCCTIDCHSMEAAEGVRSDKEPDVE